MRIFCRDGFKDGIHGTWQYWWEDYENRRDFIDDRNANNPAFAPKRANYSFRKAA